MLIYLVGLLVTNQYLATGRNKDPNPRHQRCGDLKSSMKCHYLTAADGAVNS
jgi:hypothetical protein